LGNVARKFFEKRRTVIGIQVVEQACYPVDIFGQPFDDLLLRFVFQVLKGVLAFPWAVGGTE
jgi:hypothetical protein